jgi:hypothetical protein
MLIGRIPAATIEQVSAAVAKTIAFEAAAAGAPWRSRGILVADDDDAAFEAISDSLARHFDPGAAIHFRARTWPRDRSLPGDISAAIHEGVLAVNYVGHGNVDLWGPWPGGSRIFQNADIQRLVNEAAYPVLTTASCMNGWIDHPIRHRSLAEAWVTHEHGGVAAWSPSGYTTAAQAAPLLAGFYERLMKATKDAPARGDPPATLGAVTHEAARAAVESDGVAEDVMRMFILIGDPALRLTRISPEPGSSVLALPWLAGSRSSRDSYPPRWRGG